MNFYSTTNCHWTHDRAPQSLWPCRHGWIAIVFFVLCYIPWSTVVLAATEEPPVAVPEYTRDIQPIFNRYCVGCHGADAPEAGLRLDSYAGIQAGSSNGPIVGAGADKSCKLSDVLNGDGDLKMPPEDQPPLDELASKLLSQWILSGALGPEESQAFAPSVTSVVPSHTSPNPVTAVAWHQAGRFLASAAANEVVISEDIPTFCAPRVDTNSTSPDANSTRKTIPLGMSRVADLAFLAASSKLVIATGSEGIQGHVSLWDFSEVEPREVERWVDHTDMIYALAVSPDGQRVATGSYDRTIVIRDLIQNKVLHILKGHNGAIFDVAFSNDGKVLVSASADATVKVWNVENGQRLDTLSQPLKEQLSVDMCPTGKWIAAAGEDNRIRLWDWLSTDSAQINPLRIARFGHEGSIYCVRFTPDGRFLLSLSADRSIKVWSVPELTLVYEFGTQPSNTQVMSISPNGNFLAVGRMDGTQDVFPLPPVATTSVVSKNVLERRISEVQVSEGLHAEDHRALNDNMMALDSEPNDSLSQAIQVELPFQVDGVISQHPHQLSTGSTIEADQDLYRFKAQAGSEWVFEVRAQADKSLLDSYLAVLTTSGKPVPRVRLQATRDSYFTFRGKNSDDTGDFRVHNWEEMRLNQYLYANGEVVKLFHYPRGPDSGFNVYPNEGLRHGFFDTTPVAHAVNEPCYVVEAHAPDVDVEASGLPSFLLPYENDDDSDRSAGADSRLNFMAPAEGEFILLIKDVRGLSGSEYRYRLTARPRRPDFSGRIIREETSVTPGIGMRFGIALDRKDHFDGPVNVYFTGVPDGIVVPQPLIVEAGHSRASGTLFVPTTFPTDFDWTQVKLEVHAESTIDGETQRRPLGDFGKIEINPSKSPISVELLASASSGQADVIEIYPGGSASAEIRIDRKEFLGRVGFGNEEAVWNLPHGVYVANTGLNGVLIVEDATERTIFLQAETWVLPGDRWVFVEADVDGRPTSTPVLLRVLSPR